jgi:alkylhydroperoxidase family enzyme
MLLAVAGLNQPQVEDRVRVLASGDWSPFSPRERVALLFAKKLSRDPGRINDADVARLRAHWGSERALDFIYHVAWCNFMTRVADAFQIPLERDNVFQPPQRPAQK